MTAGEEYSQGQTHNHHPSSSHQSPEYQNWIPALADLQHCSLPLLRGKIGLHIFQHYKYCELSTMLTWPILTTLSTILQYHHPITIPTLANSLPYQPTSQMSWHICTLPLITLTTDYFYTNISLLTPPRPPHCHPAHHYQPLDQSLSPPPTTHLATTITL